MPTASASAQSNGAISPGDGRVEPQGGSAPPTDTVAATGAPDRKVGGSSRFQPGPRAFRPEHDCGALSKRTGSPCKNAKGYKTDHPGFAHCKLHFGNTPNDHKHAASEAKAKAALESFVDLSLSKIGDALAREAAARAFGTDEANAEDFARNVTAFGRAADRAEGSKITIDSKLEFLARLPDAELDAAIAEAQRLVTVVKGGQA